jgi:hypothetical protein
VILASLDHGDGGGSSLRSITESAGVIVAALDHGTVGVIVAAVEHGGEGGG